MAQLALNNHVSETTKTTLFAVNYGKDLLMFYNIRSSLDVHVATSNVAGLKRLYKDISNNIILSQARIIKARYKENKDGP